MRISLLTIAAWICAFIVMVLIVCLVREVSEPMLVLTETKGK